MEAEDWYEAIASGIAAALVGGLAYACFLGVRDPEVGWLGHLFALLMFLGFLPGLCFAVAMFLEPFSPPSPPRQKGALGARGRGLSR